MNKTQETEQCICCGGTETSTVYKFSDLPEYKQIGDSKDIVQCEECSLMYCHPRNTGESMLDIYESNYWQEYQTQVGEPEIDERTGEFERISDERISYIQEFVSHGKLLDVGCCRGFLVNSARKEGFEAYGIDLNQKDIDDGIRDYMINIKKCFLEDYSEYEFDVITSFNVLEHVSDPLKMLLEKKKRLKKSGLIVVGTHDVECKNHKEEKENWKHIIPNEHLYFFSTSTLRKLGEKAGLKMIYFNKPIENGIVAYFESL